ncbi:hypothetical protein [Microbispora sp. GKU 823]|uniref:hypothetical protein n=1 Tax=Microbispora sp. GKU 823 TaxID=1652100 RepID=UPI0015C4CFAC|nr:hypothetical protein [Microbispora sp. GKU 823]
MSVSAKARLAGSMLRIAGHTLRERVAKPRVATAEDIPGSYHDITEEWLSAVLCREHPGARVLGFERGAGSEGTTSRQAMTVLYNEAGRQAGLPEAVFAKFTSKLLSRMLVGPAAAVSSEARFYRFVRPGLSIEAPVGYYAAYDERSWRSMFLLEDVMTTRGAGREIRRCTWTGRWPRAWWSSWPLSTAPSGTAPGWLPISPGCRTPRRTRST